MLAMTRSKGHIRLLQSQEVFLYEGETKGNQFCDCTAALGVSFKKLEMVEALEQLLKTWSIKDSIIGKNTKKCLAPCISS